MQRYPSHVCDTWMGHSSKVAAKHYLQVTDAHWKRASTEILDSDHQTDGRAALPEKDGGVIPAAAGANRSNHDTKKPSDSLLGMAGHDSGVPAKYPRRDSNP